MGRSRKKRLPEEAVRASVESLSHDGRGVARINGKTVFIDGALPGEEVMCRYRACRKDYDEARVDEVLVAAAERVAPRCAHFGVCGGCSLQHMDPGRQILAKQEVLLENLRRIGGVEPQTVLPPLTGPHWGYRTKARLGVRYVVRKSRVLVGFREQRSSYVADIARCEILHHSVSNLMPALAGLIEGLTVCRRIPQIEVAVGEGVTALVFRHLDPLSVNDREALHAFGESRNICIYLQPGGQDSVHALWPPDPVLEYHLPDQGVAIQFQPGDFTQVNPVMNRKMVHRVLELLDPRPGERVLDLFCGLGNFTLPIARYADSVTGIEGDRGLVERARQNGRRNGSANTEFHVADLEEFSSELEWMQKPCDKVLLDPPRSGAANVVAGLRALAADRIVYVSCHPGSLARDAGLLVNEQGYLLASAGVMDMFPHTAHVESIALFERR